MVNTYARMGKGTVEIPNLNLNKDGENVSAEYTGPAIGISYHNDQSGEFTAKVSLKVDFMNTDATPSVETPMITGKISGFEGDAANSNWNVELVKSVFTGAQIAVDEVDNDRFVRFDRR